LSSSDPFADSERSSVIAEGLTLVLLIISIAAWAAPIRTHLGPTVLSHAIRVALPLAIAFQWALRSRYLGRPQGLACLARDGLGVWALLLVVVDVPLAFIPGWGPVAAMMVPIFVGGTVLTRRGWGLIYAGVLIVAASAGGNLTSGLTGFVFNVMLIVRAPLQLFQAIQTSLLPHLTGLEATEGHAAFAHAIRVTIRAIAAFAGAVALGLLAIGPFVMEHLFGQHYAYNRFGLALIGLGMGMHLASGALNQAVLARDQARVAAICWAVAAVVFVLWMFSPIVGEELLRTEIGYLGATSLLALMLSVVYKRGARMSQAAPAAAAIAR